MHNLIILIIIITNNNIQLPALVDLCSNPKHQNLPLDVYCTALLALASSACNIYQCPCKLYSNPVPISADNKNEPDSEPGPTTDRYKQIVGAVRAAAAGELGCEAKWARRSGEEPEVIEKVAKVGDVGINDAVTTHALLAAQWLCQADYVAIAREVLARGLCEGSVGSTACRLLACAALPSENENEACSIGTCVDPPQALESKAPAVTPSQRPVEVNGKSEQIEGLLAAVVANAQAEGVGRYKVRYACAYAEEALSRHNFARSRSRRTSEASRLSGPFPAISDWPPLLRHRSPCGPGFGLKFPRPLKSEIRAWLKWLERYNNNST